MPMKTRCERVPNFVIVGAPKCGTTALWSYLKDHPAVYFPAIKEPNYFCGVGLRGIDGQMSYLDLFNDRDDQQICGEASTVYMVYETAIPKILDWNSDAKIIALVRNPIDMAISYHGHMVYALWESEKRFEPAWRRRTLPTEVGPRCGDPELLNYRRVCRLGEQVARMMRKVPKDQLHVIVYDDLRIDPKAVYERVLDFLRVTRNGRSHFPIVGARRRHRSEYIGRLLMAPPAPLGGIKEWVRRRAPRAYRAVARKMLNLNQRSERRPEVPEALHAELLSEFSSDIALLESLLN